MNGFNAYNTIKKFNIFSSFVFYLMCEMLIFKKVAKRQGRKAYLNVCRLSNDKNEKKNIVSLPFNI